MKAKDWRFLSILPDEEDHEAAQKVRESVVRAAAGIRMNDGERDVFIADSAFFRGMAWARAKAQ